jgi:hypothetical protein
MFKGISQTASDSITCIPTIQLKKAINIIENGKIVKQELELNKHKVIVLDSMLVSKELIIEQYQDKDRFNKNVFNNYRETILNLNKKVANQQVANTIANLRLAKQKAKKWATFVIGIGVGFLIFH